MWLNFLEIPMTKSPRLCFPSHAPGEKVIYTSPTPMLQAQALSQTHTHRCTATYSLGAPSGYSVKQNQRRVALQQSGFLVRSL